MIPLTSWILGKQRNVGIQFRKANIFIELNLVAVKNDIQKTGPVFSEIARVACERGTDYFYRINDDSEFLNPWAYKFVRAIQVIIKSQATARDGSYAV